MEKVRQFISAIIAGFILGIGGTVFLTQGNSVVGSFLFAIGLYSIIVFRLQLYTGKIGYLPFQKLSYCVELGLTWAGNLLGTFISAMFIRNTRIFAGFSERVGEISQVKLEDGALSIFLLSIFCGVLMFIAVDAYRIGKGSTLKALAIFIPVMVFILSGFEHVIANMFYFSLAGVWDLHCLIWVIIMTIGNSIGGMMIPVYQKAFHIERE